MVVVFQVGEQANFLKQFVGEVLGLVDDEEALPSLGVLLDEEIVEFPQQGRFVLGCGGHAEVVEHHFQKLLGTDLGIENLGQGDVGQLAFDELTQDGRFTRADLAGQQEETTLLLDTIRQIVECLAVCRTQIEIGRIGYQVERLAGEIEKGFVHVVLRSVMTPV